MSEQINESNGTPATATERRSDGRIEVEGSVCVSIMQADILGPSRNVSREGIYFIAEAELPVEVTLPTSGDKVRGRIVRIGAVRDGEVGVAIKFDVPLSDEQLPPQD